MIPESRLSTTNLPSTFLAPDSLVMNANIDREQGGVDLDDGSQGLQVQNWIGFVDGDNLKVGPTAETAPTILVRPGVTTFSFTFDQNMRATLAYTQAGVAKLYWFDTNINAMTESSFAGASYPRLALDDKRALQSLVRDIIFAYIRNDNLYYRQQRDRYTIEYLLKIGVRGRLRNIGLTQNNRLQFMFS